MNILVVEDDELTAEFIKRVLAREHHFVQVCHDGSVGFKKAQSHSYDVVILDISLPGKDGISICRELRRLLVSTPILMLSSYADEQTKITCLDAGADDYMTKPFGYKELLARLRSVGRRPSLVIQSALQMEDVVLNPESHAVTRAGVLLQLRKKA